MTEKKLKRKIASQVKVGFPPAFVKEHIAGKGKNLADFKKEVMNIYKGQTETPLDDKTIETIREVVTILADPDKVIHGLNEIKFYGFAGINGRELAEKIIECSNELNKFKDGSGE